MKKIAAAVLSVLMVSSLSAQFSGYLGKKNLVELGMNVHVPLLYDLFYIKTYTDQFYKRSGNSLELGKDRLNPGLRLGYLRLVNNRFGVGMDINYDAVNTIMRFYDFNKTDGFDYYDGFSGENLQFRSLHINPKIEFTTKGGLLPVGISHQFGFGIKVISLVEKEYLNEVYVSSGWGTTYSLEERNYAENFTNMHPNRFVYKSFNYTLNFRKPLSEKLLLNINFRYALNLTNNRVEEYYTSNFHDHVYALLNKQQTSSVVMFNVGASYAF
ncbi:MAG: hypothetical protein K0R65_1607 [Crocinitomicaceae bacterium]|jgi:hypothetical protein|nr:hypothetical protein [Crocinitomicaceae bacterium]